MEIINFAIEKGIIEKRGSWFYFNDEKIGQGKDNTKSILLENTNLFSQIKEKVISK
jgi:recombination protein RecA